MKETMGSTTTVKALGVAFQTKCEQYWPESNSKFGAITVTLRKTAMFADYVIRTFVLVKVRRLINTFLCIYLLFF